MLAKAVILFCAQTLFVQYISAQCIGVAYNGIADGSAWRPAPYAGAWNGAYPEAPLAPCAAGFAPAAFMPAAGFNGGGFAVTSVSPIAVTGVTMTSENVYEGPLSVSGAVPFLASVALEGSLPTAGAGTITYSCGNGEVGMLSERVNGLNPYAGPYGYGAGEAGYGYAPLGYEVGIAGPGYGYGYNRGIGCGAVY